MRDHMLKWGAAPPLAAIGAVLLLVAGGCAATLTPALFWEYPLRQVEYPSSSYPVVINAGVAVVGVGRDVHALDARTGQVLWRRTNESGHKWDYRVSGGVVYLLQRRETDRVKIDAHADAISFSTNVFALDARTGNEVWRYRPTPDRWPARLFLSEGVLVVQSEPYFALDAETGRLLWEADVTGVTNRVSDGVIYAEDGGTVTALDMATGDALWRRELVEHKGIRVATDGIVLSQGFDSVVGLDTKTGETVWRREREGRRLHIKGVTGGAVIVTSARRPSPPRPLSLSVDGDNIVVVERIDYPMLFNPDEFCAVQARTGLLFWCRELEEGHYVYPLSGAVFLISRNGVAALHPRYGYELWVHDRKQDDRGFVQIKKSGGGLYVNAYGEVSARDSAADTVRWRLQWEWDDDPLDWRDDSYIMAADGDVVILWTGGGLAAVGLPH